MSALRFLISVLENHKDDFEGGENMNRCHELMNEGLKLLCSKHSIFSNTSSVGATSCSRMLRNKI